MKKVGIGICQWNIPADGTDTVFLAREMGFEGIEMDLGLGKPGQDLRDRKTLQDYIQAGKQAGMPFPTLALNGTELGRPDKRGESLRYIDEAISIAHELGAKTLQMPFFGAGEIRTREEYEQAAEVLRYACERGEGLEVGAENTLGIEGNCRLAEMVDRESFFIYYDAGNIENIRGESGEAFYRALAGRIREAHAKDQFCADPWYKARPAVLGKGECHAEQALRAMREEGFSGWIFVENNLPRQELEQDLVILKKLFE